MIRDDFADRSIRCELPYAGWRSSSGICARPCQLLRQLHICDDVMLYRRQVAVVVVTTAATVAYGIGHGLDEAV